MECGPPAFRPASNTRVRIKAVVEKKKAEIVGSGEGIVKLSDQSRGPGLVPGTWILPLILFDTFLLLPVHLKVSMARYTPLVSSIPSSYWLRILVIIIIALALFISIYSLSYVRPESRISADSLSFWKSPKVKYPFCQRCSGPQNDPICEEYGEDTLKRSLAHEGTSRRLKEKILKAQEGQPIKFAVLGGSSMRIL